MTKPKKTSTTTNTTTDVESHQNQPIRNPYSSMEPHILPALHPINILKRGSYIGFSLYGLHKLDAYHAILHSPHVSHEWFKIGLAGTIAIVMIKAYVELYAGKLQQQTVNYANFKQTTHGALLLILTSSFCFHVALWPHYGTTTFLVLFLVSVVLLQTALLIPTYLQNLISVVALTFFLQEYK
jgi:hypothetical protein